MKNVKKIKFFEYDFRTKINNLNNDNKSSNLIKKSNNIEQ